MKKQIDNHKNTPNFILLNQGVLHCFKGAIRHFSNHFATASVRQAVQNQDFLIIDNETGEIIKT